MEVFKHYFGKKAAFLFFIPFSAASQENSPAIQNIRKHLSVLEKENNLSGVVLIAKNGVPVFKSSGIPAGTMALQTNL